MEFRPMASINAADLAGVAAKLAINVAINVRVLMRGSLDSCARALPRAAAPDISLPRRAQGAGQQQGARRPARCARGRDTHFQHAKQNRDFRFGVFCLACIYIYDILYNEILYIYIMECPLPDAF